MFNRLSIIFATILVVTSANFSQARISDPDWIFIDYYTRANNIDSKSLGLEVLRVDQNSITITDTNSRLAWASFEKEKCGKKDKVCLSKIRVETNCSRDEIRYISIDDYKNSKRVNSKNYPNAEFEGISDNDPVAMELYNFICANWKITYQEGQNQGSLDLNSFLDRGNTKFISSRFRTSCEADLCKEKGWKWLYHMYDHELVCDRMEIRVIKAKVLIGNDRAKLWDLKYDKPTEEFGGWEKIGKGSVFEGICKNNLQTLQNTTLDK